MTRPEERGAREIKRHLCDSHFYHYVNKHPAPWCHKVGVHKNVYVCFSSQQGKMGSVEGRGRGEKKNDFPHSLQCCSHWVCASCSHEPQRQGCHQVVRNNQSCHKGKEKEKKKEAERPGAEEKQTPPNKRFVFYYINRIKMTESLYARCY